jgi:hypothetical protein
MYLLKDKLQHIRPVAHEGKVVVLATDAKGKISYTVKQDGFEDSYLDTQPTKEPAGKTGKLWNLLMKPIISP